VNENSFPNFFNLLVMCIYLVSSTMRISNGEYNGELQVL